MAKRKESRGIVCETRNARLRARDGAGSSKSWSLTDPKAYDLAEKGLEDHPKACVGERFAPEADSGDLALSVATRAPSGRPQLT